MTQKPFPESFLKSGATFDLTETKKLVKNLNQVFKSLNYEFCKGSAYLDSQQISQELICCLNDLYPDFTTELKQIVDGQFLDLFEWIHNKFDAIEEHVTRKCRSKEEAMEYLRSQTLQYETQANTTNMKSQIEYLWRTRIRQEQVERPTLAYHTLEEVVIAKF